MPITFKCSGCGKAYKVADEKAGKKMKCPGCQAVVTVPSGPAKKKPGKSGGAPALSDDEFDFASMASMEASADVGNEPAFTDDELPPPSDPGSSSSSRGTKRKGKNSRERSSVLPVLLIGGAIVLGLSVVGGGGFFAWKLLAAHVLHDPLMYLPDNCQMLVTIKMKEVEDSPLVQKMKLANPQINQQLDVSTKEFGSLTKAGIEQLYIATDSFASQASGVAILRTRDSVPVVELKESLGKTGTGPVTDTKVGSYTMHEQGTKAYCVADSRTVVFGTGQILRKILERNRKPEIPAALQQVMDLTDFNKQVAFAVCLPPPTPKSSSPPAALPGFSLNPFGGDNPLGDGVTGVAGSLSVASDMQIQLTAKCKDSAAAQTIKTKIDGLLELFKSLPNGQQDNPLQTLQLTLESANLKAQLTLTSDMLDKATKTMSPVASPVVVPTIPNVTLPTGLPELPSPGTP
ncbi:MAG: hypothetical protein HZA46_03615 [Planctomycetales bacterium]|nr:hypothetical protein [Planctomycetales bacterium]